MIELVKSPSTRVLSKGRLALWLVVSLVFAGLLFAVGAQAQGTNVSNGAAETPVGEAATKSGAPTEEAPAVVEQAPSVAEETPPAAEQAPPAVEQAPPAVEQAPPAVEQAPPAVEQAPPAAEQAPPVVEETPAVVERAPPVVEEAPSVVEKKTVEQTAGEVAAEAGSEATHGPGEDSQVPVGASGLTHKDATGEVAPEISIAVTTSVVPAAAPEISTSPVQDQPPLVLRSQTISARGAGQTSCVRASIAGAYAGGWFDISVTSSVSNIPFTTAEASPTAIAVGAPAGSLGDGSTVENHPSAPGSGFGGGGSGGSAAGGGSGSASSASSTLVDVLLQAAPRAMRRLRLAQPSLRTSFFVLIPERPD
ncbi:MAG TPA: hypothetical protein VHY18_01785 [Solirubrobacteraceae bacterium]|nr:hypothetical protein [Solirubrobacteraceae bacterium]